MRLSRAGAETRIDKSSRTIKVGEGIVFAVGGRVVAVRIEALGDRRGPPSEAQDALFLAWRNPGRPPTD